MAILKVSLPLLLLTWSYSYFDGATAVYIQPPGYGHTTTIKTTTSSSAHSAQSSVHPSSIGSTHDSSIASNVPSSSSASASTSEGTKPGWLPTTTTTISIPTPSGSSKPGSLSSPSKSIALLSSTGTTKPGSISSLSKSIPILSSVSGTKPGSLSTTTTSVHIITTGTKPGFLPTTTTSTIVHTPTGCTAIAPTYTASNGDVFNITCGSAYEPADQDTIATYSLSGSGSDKECYELCSKYPDMTVTEFSYLNAADNCVCLNSTLGDLFYSDIVSYGTLVSTNTCAQLGDPYTTANGTVYDVTCGAYSSTTHNIGTLFTVKTLPDCLAACDATAGCEVADFYAYADSASCALLSAPGDVETASGYGYATKRQ